MSNIEKLGGTWKSIGELTQADLEATPVWELSGSPGSEVVCPTSLTTLSEYRHGPAYIAATRYISASGETHYGYCSPADPSGLDYLQPIMLTPRGPFPLWLPGGLTQADVDTLAFALSVPPSALFPLKIECLVPVDGVLYTGCVDTV